MSKTLTFLLGVLAAVVVLIPIGAYVITGNQEQKLKAEMERDVLATRVEDLEQKNADQTSTIDQFFCSDELYPGFPEIDYTARGRVVNALKSWVKAAGITSEAVDIMTIYSGKDNPAYVWFGSDTYGVPLIVYLRDTVLRYPDGVFHPGAGCWLDAQW